jgi:hypothetical protein
MRLSLGNTSIGSSMGMCVVHDHWLHRGAVFLETHAVISCKVLQMTAAGRRLGQQGRRARSVKAFSVFPAFAI